MKINVNCSIKFFEGVPTVSNCKKNLSIINSLDKTLQLKILTNKRIIQECETTLLFLDSFADKINCDLYELLNKSTDK